MSQKIVMQRNYSKGFYEDQGDESATSAGQLVPYICEVLKPTSVLDVGCGIGHWVDKFGKAGVSVAHGVDGPWAREGGLRIGDTSFAEFDFTRNAAPYRPAGLKDRYDLVTTFEFVEHLQADFAPKLVEFFVSKADMVVIGGAIPGQGGSHHVNEQWPLYWAELMAAHDYVACDFIRPAIWTNEQIMPWYRQNTVGYFKGSAPAHVVERARREWERRVSDPLPLVHPAIFGSKCASASPNVRNIATMGDRVMRNIVKSLMGRA